MTDTLDPRVALALAALGEITDPEDVGPLLDAEVVEPGVVDLRFACLLPGYAAWHWTVSTTDLPGSEPTVLEVELLPGADALLAPPWTPWTERLAEWRRQHPDELHPGEDDPEDEADAAADEDEDLDEDDLAVDDALDVLDEAELAAAETPGIGTTSTTTSRTTRTTTPTRARTPTRTTATPRTPTRTGRPRPRRPAAVGAGRAATRAGRPPAVADPTAGASPGSGQAARPRARCRR